MSRLMVVIGLLLALFSTAANVLMGTQIALLGVCFLLVAIFMEIRKAGKS